MAAVAFDPLAYSHKLEAMTAMFIHNFDALVSKDYLDTRFDAFEAGLNASVDKQLRGIDKQFSEFRLEMHSEIGAVRKEIWELRSTLKL